MDISVVIPLLNEEESIKELYDWIAKVMLSNHFSYEVIYVDDGSSDDSFEVLKELSKKHQEVKIIKFRTNHGKSQALNAAFKVTKGDVVITMDADLQDSPDEIPELYKMIKEENMHLISGWKKKRYDPITKTVPTKLFNWAARKTSGVYLHDFNCGLKAYDHKVVKNIDVYGEMHRYIPILAKSAGFNKIDEKIVEHQARKYGTTKFGIERFLNGFLDLISIWFVSKFGKRPMHFFGAWGVFMFIIGFGAAGYLGIMKLYYLSQHLPTILVTDNPWFYISLSMMLIGTQLFLTGFVGEMIVQVKNTAPRYHIDETVNL
ncbi:MAG: glycosyltransferase [Flavobacteriales bacterium]|nr:glycosyltransferase [Flavobacteriales bacterium]